jgi:hypothetical protein
MTPSTDIVIWPDVSASAAVLLLTSPAAVAFVLTALWLATF